MRASKFTDAQKAFIIKQGEAGISVAEIYRKAGNQPGNILQLEEAVWQPDASRDEVAQMPESRCRH